MRAGVRKGHVVGNVGGVRVLLRIGKLHFLVPEIETKYKCHKLLTCLSTTLVAMCLFTIALI